MREGKNLSYGRPRVTRSPPAQNARCRFSFASYTLFVYRELCSAVTLRVGFIVRVDPLYLFGLENIGGEAVCSPGGEIGILSHDIH